MKLPRDLWRRLFGQPAEQPQAKPEPIVAVPDNSMIQLKDAMLRGWYNTSTGALFEGFRVGPEDVVADIGCGAGGHAMFCAQLGANLILTDIEPGNAAMVAAKVSAIPGHGRIEHYTSDSDPLPIADGACTKVMCTEVIEHVESAERLMAELVRIGRRGAQYLLSCPDPGSEELQKKLAAPAYFVKPNHVRVLGHEAFARLVEEAGLVIERRHSYNFFGNMWLALFWACKVPMERPEHRLLESWTRFWGELLDLPDGLRIKNALDDLMPRSQLILARKPG